MCVLATQILSIAKPTESMDNKIETRERVFFQYPKSEKWQMLETDTKTSHSIANSGRIGITQLCRGVLSSFTVSCTGE
jgi:hypothetical protein